MAVVNRVVEPLPAVDVRLKFELDEAIQSFPSWGSSFLPELRPLSTSQTCDGPGVPLHVRFRGLAYVG